MKFLFFDCETIGLPRNYKAHYSDLNNWPRVMSLAWLVTDETGNILSQHHHMIKPDGWEVPKEKFWIDNGYSTERSMAEGVELEVVLNFFMLGKMECDVLVAHNLSFDQSTVWAEILRSGKEPRLDMHTICTMDRSTYFCRIPGKFGKFKWPTLDELHTVLFRSPFQDAHNALADVVACKNCFFELLKKRVIQLPNLNTTNNAIRKI